MEKNFTIGARIKCLRKDKKLTQEALAKEIGVTRKAVDFWEKDANEPKASYIARLSEVLQVSSDFLLGLEDEFGNKTAHGCEPVYRIEKRSEKKYDLQLSEEERNLLKTIVKKLK